MKKNNKGYMLVEVLLVTIFVSSVLIFLYIQFSNLSKSYNDSYLYNTPETLYALEDINDFILSDSNFLEYLNTNIEQKKYIDITNCDLFTDKEYCLELLELENIENIFITTNSIPKDSINIYKEGFQAFINKINKEGNELYRIVAEFNNSTFATIRFGDIDE